MVYESDFYTTRRPYSRPAISSYSVTTPLRVIPGVTRMYTSYSPYTPYLYHHYIPHYSRYYGLPGSIFLPSAVPLRYYTRSTPVRVITSPLRDYSPPRIFSVHVRPSVIHRELLRIEHKPRLSYGKDAVEEYLNSSSAKEFEDEIRSMRTHSSRILQRIHAPMPRARRAISCTPFSRYGYDPVEREFYDNIRGRSVIPDDIFTLANYAEPARRYTDTILDPFRPSRKFTESPKPIDDSTFDALKSKQGDRAKRLAALSEVDELELEKIKAKRLHEQKLQEQK